MTKLTTQQVCDLTGKSKPTITRMVKKGELSRDNKKDKTFLFDASEIMRVFPEITLDKIEKLSENKPLHIVSKVSGETENETFHEKKYEMLELEKEVEILKVKLESLEKNQTQLEKLNDNLEEKNQTLEEKNNKLTDELLSLSKRLLPPPEKEEVKPEPPKRKKFLGIF